MARVVLGNRHAVHSPDNGETHEPLKGKRATVVETGDLSVSQAFQAITAPQGVWAAHATEDSRPNWVASDSPALASLLAEHFGGVEIRELEES